VSKELTPTMKELIGYMREHDGKIHRHPGGFWARGQSFAYLGKSYGTSSVEALVKRGIARYSDWQEGRNGRFPIEATLIA
jgi:hypothetical protein